MEGCAKKLGVAQKALQGDLGTDGAKEEWIFLPLNYKDMRAMADPWQRVSKIL